MIYPSYHRNNERKVVKMFTTSFIRRSLTGAAVCAISFLLVCGTGCHSGKDTGSEAIQPTTTEVTTCLSTTTSTSTSLTTTSTTTTSETTTELMTIAEVPTTTVQVNTAPTEPYVEPVTEYVAEPVGYNEADAVLMAQVINKEASASYDGKLAVASVIVNRSNYFGQSITDVVYAPNQFSVVYNLGSYTADDYNAAVQVLTNGSVNNAYYFDGCHPDRLNHFRDINNNYIGAW